MEQFTVRILERDYRLSCEAAERDTLLAAVERVDHGMRAIRAQGKVAGTERIAVFAALNLAGALLARESDEQPTPPRGDEAHAAAAAEPVADPEILRRMQSINALLDTALSSQEDLF